MREEQIQGKVPNRVKQTTNSHHDDPIAANVLDRAFTAAAPNQRWVGDTTECVIPWNTAKNAVSHRLHTHHLLPQKNDEERQAIN